MKTKTESTFAERIKLIRKHFDLSQSSFAKRIGISPTNLSAIENNKYNPGSDILVGILEEFNVESDYLMLGKGPMFPREDEGVQLDKEVANDPHVKKFLYYFNSSEFVRFYILAQFSKFYLQEKEYIELVLEAEKGEESPPQP